MKKNIVFPILVFLASCSTEGTQDEVFNETSEALQLLSGDMRLKHEGIPSGVPETYNWVEGPRIGYGNFPPEGWNAFLPWGQVYLEKGATPKASTWFQIKNLQAWYLSEKSNTWIEWVNTSTIDGANYAENFQDDANIPADIVVNGINGISSTLQAGYNFHFWNGEGRTSIDPDDIAGIWVSLESRIVQNAEGDENDTEPPKLLMGAGADYWRSLDAPWDNFTTNGDVMIGRFRFLTNEWQTFHAHTLNDQQIRTNPPPI